MTPITIERPGSVRRLRAAERRNAVRDRLDPGQRAAAGRERAQDDDQSDACRQSHRRRIGHVRRGQPDTRPRTKPIATSAPTEAMNAYVGSANAYPDSRTPRRLTSTSSTSTDEAESDRVRRKLGNGRRDGEHARGDRHRGGQDVVGEERGGGDEPGGGAEVLLRDDVRPAAVRIRVDRLAVREHHDREQRRDHDRDRHDQVARGERGRDQHEQARLGGVGHRRERIRREDRQREPLRQELALELRERHPSPDKRPLQSPCASDAEATSRRPRRSRGPDGAGR